MFGRRNKQARPAAAAQVSPLTAGEVSWRDTQVEAAGLIVERYLGAGQGQPSLERLDACVDAWHDDDASRVDVNTLVNALGIAFGVHVARDASLDWVIATDAQGSDLALHSQPGDVLIYPANAVAKRITAGERGFMTSLHSAMVEQAAAVRASA